MRACALKLHPHQQHTWPTSLCICFFLLLERYQGKDPSVELPTLIIKNRCGGGALGERDKNETSDLSYVWHCGGDG